MVTENPSFNLSQLLREAAERAATAEAQSKIKDLEPKIQITNLAPELTRPKVVAGGAFDFENGQAQFYYLGEMGQDYRVDNPIVELFNAVQQQVYSQITIAESLGIIKTVETVDQIDLESDIPAIIRPITFTPLGTQYSEKNGISTMVLIPRSHDFDDDWELNTDEFIKNMKFTIKNYIADEFIDCVNRFFADDNGFLLYTHLLEQKFIPAQTRLDRLKSIKDKSVALKKQKDIAEEARNQAKADLASSLKAFIVNQLRLPNPRSKKIIRKIDNSITYKDLFYGINRSSVLKLLQQD